MKGIQTHGKADIPHHTGVYCTAREFSVDRTNDRMRDLLSAAFLLRAPVTVETAGATYADTYVIAVVDADETASDAVVLLSRMNEQQDTIGVTVNEITGVIGVSDDDLRRAALVPAT